MLYWCEPEEEAIVPSIEGLRVDGKDNKRSVSLMNVLEIRRGVDLDPLKAGYCGTAVLRKHCEPANYAYCFSLITADRSVNTLEQYLLPLVSCKLQVRLLFSCALAISDCLINP